MKDANGIELATGMIVEITGAYFKNDNALYFIDYAPGDPTWTGSDFGLHKICKNGKPSAARHNVGFWPLSYFCSDASKNAAAKKHDAKNATITVRTDIPTDQISAYFAEKAVDAKKTLDWDRRMGHSPKVLAREEQIIEHYTMLASKLAA